MTSELSWSHLPTLCVAAILDQLSCRDALQTSSTCRAWRAALSLYNGHRESVKLVAHREHYERNTLLAQLFRRRARRLCVELRCRGTELEKFVHFILMRFCEAKALEEIEFVAGAQYLRFEEQATIETLRNAITTPLLHSQRHSVRRVTLHGCGNLLPLQLQEPEEPMSYRNLRSIAATNVRHTAGPCGAPVHPFPFSTLQSVAMDYGSLDGVAMRGLASLPHLRHLALNVQRVCKSQARQLCWADLLLYYDLRVEVTLNVINLTESELHLLKLYVLAVDLPLAVIRVFFCRTGSSTVLKMHALCRVKHVGSGRYCALILDLELVQAVVDSYSESLREFHWADAPSDSGDRHNFDMADMQPTHFINPFVMMCWQCPRIEDIVIHGYWVVAYDVLGMARLRAATLRRLAVSALLQWEGPFPRRPVDSAPPLSPQFDAVHARCQLPVCWDPFVEEINDILQFNWKPSTYADMHPALTPQTSKENRYNYILQETLADIRRPLVDVT